MSRYLLEKLACNAGGGSVSRVLCVSFCILNYRFGASGVGLEGAPGEWLPVICHNRHSARYGRAIVQNPQRIAL